MKRLTIDIPNDLHRRFKTTCAERGLCMNEVMLGLLEIAMQPQTPLDMARQRIHSILLNKIEQVTSGAIQL